MLWCLGLSDRVSFLVFRVTSHLATNNKGESHIESTTLRIDIFIEHADSIFVLLGHSCSTVLGIVYLIVKNSHATSHSLHPLRSSKGSPGFFLIDVSLIAQQTIHVRCLELNDFRNRTSVCWVRAHHISLRVVRMRHIQTPQTPDTQERVLMSRNATPWIFSDRTVSHVGIGFSIPELIFLSHLPSTSQNNTTPESGCQRYHDTTSP
jgi:hypothetical protein